MARQTHYINATLSNFNRKLELACNREVQKLFLHNFTRAHPEVYVLKDQI